MTGTVFVGNDDDEEINGDRSSKKKGNLSGSSPGGSHSISLFAPPRSAMVGRMLQSLASPAVQAWGPCKSRRAQRGIALAWELCVPLAGSGRVGSNG